MPAESSHVIFNQTEDLLAKLGYEYAWRTDGDSAIVMTDYPGRPVVDYFTLVYVTPPVGYTKPSTMEKPTGHFYFRRPAFSRVDPLAFEGPDIRDALKELCSEVEALIVAHELGAELSIVAPLLNVLDGNVQQVRQCLERKIHAKWLGDMFAFGLTFDEALEIKGVPYKTLYKLYAP